MIAILAFSAALQAEPMIEARSAEVLAGDMLLVSGRRVRLWGLAMPQPDAQCTDDGGEPYACHAAARTLLSDEIARAKESLEFLAGQIHRQYEHAPSLRCEVMGQDDDSIPLARCRTLNPNCIPQSVECDDHWVDLAQEIITIGAGLPRRALVAGAYDEAEGVARHARLGLWGLDGGTGDPLREPPQPVGQAADGGLGGDAAHRAAWTADVGDLHGFAATVTETQDESVSLWLSYAYMPGPRTSEVLTFGLKYEGAGPALGSPQNAPAAVWIETADDERFFATRADFVEDLPSGWAIRFAFSDDDGLVSADDPDCEVARALANGGPITVGVTAADGSRGAYRFSGDNAAASIQGAIRHCT